MGNTVLRRRLRGLGLGLQIGPFAVCIRSANPIVEAGIATLYADYRVFDDPFADFHVAVLPGAGLRRWLYRQARFDFDGDTPFQPLPRAHGFAMLEWGLNWTFGNHAHGYLIVHAAVVERGGRALLMPGYPGSGKSTLCAALVNRGWRLLSDELALLDPETLAVTPIPRPISLKNESIGVMRRFAPGAVFGPVSHDTSKGTVCHLRAPADSVVRSREPALPAWVIFPRFEHGAACIRAPHPPGRTLLRLADNAFNYNVHGVRGFEALARMAESTRSHALTYGDLHAALETVDEICGNDPLQERRSGTA